jgi:hypothetical protein
MPRYSSYSGRDTPVAEEADVGFSRFNNRLRPDQLQPGELAMSINGRMNVDGTWQVRPGVDTFGPKIGSIDESLSLPFNVWPQVVISSATRSGTTVTITTSTNHGFSSSYVVAIVDVGTGTVNPNGNKTITVTGLNTFTYTIAGATGSETYSVTGSSKAGGAIVGTANINGAFGSCLFSNPASSNAEYIILALYGNAVAINMQTQASTTINYPTGINIASEVSMLQAFNKVFIFRDGQTALEWNGSFSGTPAFTKVANGDYATSTYLDASNNTSITDGIVTVTATSHGLLVGDRIFVVDNGTTTLTENGTGYVVATVPGTGSFTFFAEVPDSAATTVVYAKKQPSQLGFTHMPAPPWGVYHQRRIIVPYYYTTTGSSGSETVTSRNVRDEILLSDVFDSDTYDRIQNQLKVTAGIADYLQYVHPFTEDNAVIFNRNSIHLMMGLSGSIADIALKEITREAGLVARKSVVTIGDRIFFLSDNGVYSTSFQDLYNLRGAGLPLSDPINPLIKRINPEYAQNAVAVYHDNRYWIAVPIDGSTRNNAILIYNLLNQGWESLDLIDNTGWDISNLIVSGAGGINKLYAVNRFGGIHVIDERPDAFDYIYTAPGLDAQPFPIESEVTTRQYIFGDVGRKSFNAYELHVESSEYELSDGDLTMITENIDKEVEMYSLAESLGFDLPVGEDSSIRGRIGNVRGYGIQAKFTPTKGRPKLRMVKIEASQAFRSVTEAS